MAKGQDNGTTIQLGLKVTKWGEVWEGEDRMIVRSETKGRQKCPHCRSASLYSHGECKPGEVLHT